MSTVVLGTCVVLAACKDRNNNGIPDSAAMPAAVDSAAGAVANAMTADTPDAEIVGALWAANRGQVDYSKVGADKTTDPDVKKLARQMITDHTAMLNEVTGLITKTGITPDTTKGKAEDFLEDTRKDIVDLSGKTGKDFNDEFVEEQIDAHQQTMDLLEDVDEDADNPELKAAIEAAKPKVQAHLDAWKALKAKKSSM